MMGWNGNGMGAAGWLMMGVVAVFWLLLLGLIVWLVVRLLPASGSSAQRDNEDRALDILDRRLANGGIDLAAWQAQRDALMGVRRDSR